MSGTLGIGGGKSSGKQTDPTGLALASIAKGFNKEIGGLRRDLISQLNEVLTTGGSRLPLFSQAEEQSRLASSNALRQTEGDLYRQGLAGTPFGASIMGQTRQQGEQAVSSTHNAILQQLFNMIPNFVLGQSQAALSGLGGAVGSNVKASGTNIGGGTQVGFGKLFGG